jgi:diketogulonate reductase-like aldo/keto reductase
MTVIDDSHSAPGAIPTVALNDEAKMPVLGLGMAKLSDAETESSVLAALEAGCRLIDTAAAYGNEDAVGRAIAASNIPRDELFVTTKLGTSKQGFDSAQEACKASLDQLGLDYLDLYLIHWPGADAGQVRGEFRGHDPVPRAGSRPIDRCIELHRGTPIDGDRRNLPGARGEPDRTAPPPQPG